MRTGATSLAMAFAATLGLYLVTGNLTAAVAMNITMWQLVVLAISAGLCYAA